MKELLVTTAIFGAAPTPVIAVIPCRRLEITEDDSVTPQGIVVFFPDDNFVQGYTFAPGRQPVIRGNTVAAGGGRGAILGHPIQRDAGNTVTLRPADILFKVTSATATFTKIRVVEID